MPRRSGKATVSKGAQLWFGILLVLAVQFAFILWLGDRRPIQPRAPSAAPQIQVIAPLGSNTLRLLDPTLFALPHEEGFAGAGWLIPPLQEIQPFAWSEPARWLELQIGQLGAAFSQSIGTNRFQPLPSPATLEAELLTPPLTGAAPMIQRSTFRLEGTLAARKLLKSPDLPSWPYAELVSNTVVQVLVDAQGLPFSFSLLERSGDPEADRYALNEARKARFEPLRSGDAPAVESLALGTLVFEWHTIPATVNKNPQPRSP